MLGEPVSPIRQVKMTTPPSGKPGGVGRWDRSTKAVREMYPSSEGDSTPESTPARLPAEILRANLPLFPICGKSKSDHQRKPLEEALALPYLQLSGKARLKGKLHYRLTCVALDLDGKHWHAHDFQDLDLPPPDAAIHNPGKPSTHAIWVVAFPVWVPIGAKARPFSSSRQPWELYLAVEEYLVAATGADRSLRTLKVKNPWSDEHRTTWTRAGHARTLDELVQWIPERKLEPAIEREEDDGRGRNVTLFGRALRAAGELARKVGQSIDDLTEALYNVGDQLNDFLEPLPVGEVRSTLRSAARYASSWTLRSEGTPGGRRAVQGLAPEEVKERQSAAAFRTNEMRKSRTLEELLRVVGLMAADGATMTKAAVVRASGMAWHSVSRVWDALMAHCSTVSLYTVPAITGEGGRQHGQLEADKAPVEARLESGSDSHLPVDSLPDAQSHQKIPVLIPVSACALSNFPPILPPKTVTKGDITMAFTREHVMDSRLGHHEMWILDDRIWLIRRWVDNNGAFRITLCRESVVHGEAFTSEGALIFHMLEQRLQTRDDWDSVGAVLDALRDADITSSRTWHGMRPTPKVTL